MIQGLHHMAFRCRDTEETRAFYEEVIGLEFVHAMEIRATQTGRPVRVLHSFFRMADGSTLAFFEVPDMPFEATPRHDFDLHVALVADAAGVARAAARAREKGLELRGPADHGMIRSHYFRDPNGYVVELCEPAPGEPPWSRGEAMRVLGQWRQGISPG